MSTSRRLVRVSLNQRERDKRLTSTETKPTSNGSDPRSPALHDHDRVYYSAAFRRLAGVTQVMTPAPEGFVAHNRLTHSIKVSQVARAIAQTLIDDSAKRQAIESLGGIDVDVVETAALAHDLGHPPFGHIGESVLDEYARDTLGLLDGFEANAQTFRIVTRLEPRSSSDTGLNLTRASRAAVLKYPWLRASRRDDHAIACDTDRTYRLCWTKFGSYIADRVAFADAREFLTDIQDDVQTLEAAVMDIADDITYAIHDLEDFHTAGILAIAEARDSVETWLQTYDAANDEDGHDKGAANPFERLRARLSNDYADRFDGATYREAAGDVANHLGSLVGESVGHRRAMTHVRQFVSRLITDYVGGVFLNVGKLDISHPPVLLDRLHWHQIQILKEITQRFIIQRPDVAVVQRGQQCILTELLDALAKWCSDTKERSRLPRRLGDEYGESNSRAIIDYAATLTDHQAIALHRALTGSGPSSLPTRFV